MLKYKIFNPNRFTVPLMLKDKENATFTQVNILPRTSIDITGDQVSDSVKNLTSPPRNVLRMTRIAEEKKAASAAKPVIAATAEKPQDAQKPADKNAKNKNGGGK